MGNTFIKEITFKGFKSFGQEEVRIKLGKGYTCVVGPNGSGKSNIIDGLCFALGRLSKKTMRAENLTDLIFVGTKTKKPATRAEVAIVFDNTENVFQGFIGQDLIISREVNDKGKSTYRLNGQRTTREVILMNLALANVDPDGFNFILQGKIVELTHMSPEDRRIFIEDLVGLQKFDDEKNAALKELEKADQDLVKFEAIFQEVARQLKSVEKERNDALRWLELDKKIKEFNSRLIALNIKKLRDEEEQLLVFIAETKKKIDEINEDITSTQNEIDKETSTMSELEHKIENLELTRNELEEKVSSLRSELSSKKTELKMFQENLEKLKERLQGLVEKQEKLQPGQTYEELLATVQQEIEAIDIQMSKTRSEIQDRENQEAKLESEITIFQQELNAYNKKLNTTSSSKSSLETESKMTQERLVKLQSKKTSLEKDLSKLLKNKDEDINAAMATAEKEAKEIQDHIEKIKLELKKETQKQKNFEAEIDLLRKQVSKFQSQVADQRSKIQVAKSAQEFMDKQIFTISREVKTLEINKVKYNEEIQVFSADLNKLKDQVNSKQKLLDDLRQERAAVEKEIENTQKEYDNVEGEMFSVMQTLSILTENYKDGISELQADIQDKGIDTVEDSMQDFRDYILDIIEMLGTVKTLANEQKYDDLGQAFMSMDIFVENYEESLSLLKNEIQNNISDLVKNNASNFTNFIKDLMEIIDQVNISLRRMSATRNTEQINRIHELDKKKSEMLDEFNALNVSKTKMEGDLKQASMEFANIENKLKTFDVQVTDLKKSIDEKNKECADHEEKIKAIEQDMGGIQVKIDEKSKEKEQFWELSNKLNQEIEDKNKVLQGVQDKIRGLQTVQKLIRDIEEHETEIEDSKTKISSNDEKIQKLIDEIKTIESDRASKEKDIQDLRKQKETVAQEQRDLRTRLEEENKQNQGKQRRQAQLQSMIQRAKEISELQGELEQIEAALDEGEKKVTDLGANIKELDTKKNDVVEEIGTLNGRKQQVWERQKALQDELSKLNTVHGTNSNKLSNFQARKQEIGIKIEELYTQSTEFGALPEVMEGWTETGIKADITKAQEEKRILEPVNLKAIEQYEFVKNRFDDIDLRRQSLQRERKAILENIERIETEKTRQFMRAFNEMNLHFSEIFTKLSPGGIAKMLLENPAKPFEGGLAIEARPRGKKITSIESLSGGEKTLVALSFIFAVERFQPSPFYVMDEIDAALDGPNVHRVSMVIREFSGHSQFIVISHREENIVNADKIYGVSMKDSITDVYSINLEDAEIVEDDKSMGDILKDEDAS
nr:chromosome segregation SMC family protein [Candidatus Sigynarchaeota archaeon]